MQRLHVVGLTKDREGLILSARRGTKSGAWTVNVDAELEEFVAELLKERGGEAESRIPRAESQLSVREMQQRLHAGQSIRQVARAAGVHDEWVERFAVPIQAEQTQIVRQALELTFNKQRLGVSSQPLGVSVWWNLQDRSVVLPEDGWATGWTAFLVRDSKWVVRFEYEARKRHQFAEWEVDLRERTLTSRNRLATELGYVESGRRRRPGPPPPVAGGLLTRAAPPVIEAPPPEPPPVVEAPPAPAPKRRRAAPKSAAKKAVAKKPVAKRPVAKKRAPKRVAPKKSSAKRAAPKKAAAKRPAPKKAAPKRAVAKRPPRKKAAAPAKPPVVAAPRPALPAPRAAGPLLRARGGADPGAGSGATAPVASPPLIPQRYRRGVESSLTDRVVAVGRDAGLVAVGVTTAAPFLSTRHDLEQRRDEGLADTMQFTYRNPTRSTDPARALAGARALVAGAWPTPPAADTEPAPREGRVARYAWRDHYAQLRDALTTMATELRDAGYDARVYADDNAFVDRAVAQRAGIGWFGKNANVLVPGYGSWVVLGCVVTTAPLTPSAEPVADGCGACTRCLDACPTQAIVAPGVVDARRSLAWLVQAPGTFPHEYRVALGDRIYGCDDCQEVCPPARAADRRESDSVTDARPWVNLLEMLRATDEELLATHGRWYIAERDVRHLRRNALLALGNSAEPDDGEVRDALRLFASGDDALLTEHATWALARLDERRG